MFPTKLGQTVIIAEFNHWVPLTEQQIQEEYKWEYISHQKRAGFDPWPTLEDFRRAIKDGEVMTLTEQLDRKIGNRSRCNSLASLKSLTSGYRFPRDVDRIVKGFENNDPMAYPLVLRDKGRMWIMSGNTRTDAAFILGVTPKILVLDVPSN